MSARSEFNPATATPLEKKERDDLRTQAELARMEADDLPPVFVPLTKLVQPVGT